MHRNPNIDVLKGLAITLVIWGHVMQFLVYEPIYLDNVFWRTLHMVRMPLFIFISGFLSVGAVSRNFKDLAKSRFWSLFIPLCIWSSLLYILKLSVGYVQFDASSLLGIAKSLVGGIVYEYWFIWVLLYSVFLSNIVYRICSKQWALLLAVLFIWLLPEMKIPYIHYMKTMYPFFIMGYMASVYKDRLKFVSSGYFTFAACAVFILCSCYCSVYTSMFVPPRFLDVWNAHANYIYIIVFYLFFIVAGLSGSFLCYKLVHIIPANGWLYATFKDIGRYTFAIYMIQGLWFFSFCRQYDFRVFNQPVAFIAGLAITYVVYRISKVLATNRHTALLAGYWK